MPLEIHRGSKRVVDTSGKPLVQPTGITRDTSDSETASLTIASSGSSISSVPTPKRASRPHQVTKDDDTLDRIVTSVKNNHKGDDLTWDETLATVDESLADGTLEDTLLTIGESTVEEDGTLGTEDDSTIAGESLTKRIMNRRRTPRVQFDTVKSLQFPLDGIRSMARLGQNKTLKKKCLLPKGVSKDEIHVHVTLDEGNRRTQETIEKLLALGSDDKTEQIPLSHRVLEAVQNDLRSVYTATADEAKIMLCVVIVVASDGSLSRTITDRHSVMGLAEIGFAYRLFDADDLTLFDGGLVVKRKEVSKKLRDYNWTENEGLQALMKELIPQAGNDLVSRMGHVNNELLVEI